MAKQIPTKVEIMTCTPTVPVDIAAAYLGMCPQSVREGMKDGCLDIGKRVNNRCYIYPSKLIACKEGIEVAEQCQSELKTIGRLMEMGIICFDDVLALVHR